MVPATESRGSKNSMAPSSALASEYGSSAGNGMATARLYFAFSASSDASAAPGGSARVTAAQSRMAIAKKVWSTGRVNVAFLRVPGRVASKRLCNENTEQCVNHASFAGSLGHVWLLPDLGSSGEDYRAIAFADAALCDA